MTDVKLAVHLNTLQSPSSRICYYNVALLYDSKQLGSDHYCRMPLCRFDIADIAVSASFTIVNIVVIDGFIAADIAAV